MKRYVSLEEISDGKLYQINDMVKADCHGCEGCSQCCRGMGKSIVLDPYDVYRLTLGLQTTMEGLLQHYLEWNVVDGVVLPNLKMVGADEHCSFLDENGRCSIHSLRPGICRIFPLGRYYEENGFRYFLQTEECSANSRSKIKVSKWIDTPDLRRNQQFIKEWHDFLNALEDRLSECTEDAEKTRLNLEMLHTFYMTPYDADGTFYEQFEERMQGK